MAWNDEEGLKGLRLAQCKLTLFNLFYQLSKAVMSLLGGE